MGVTLIAAVLGSVVGAILALTGAGGGVLAVPLLVFGLHLSIAQAAPVGLFAVGTASALGAVMGLRKAEVRYRAAAFIGAVGMLVAPLGLQLARVLPNKPLMLAFAAVLAFAALRTLRRSPMAASVADVSRRLPCVTDPATGRLLWTRRCMWALAGTGALSGALSGLLGVGGGFVIVPALNRFSNLEVRKVIATSLSVIAIVSIGAITAAAWQGAVVWRIALPFGAGAVVALAAIRPVAVRLTGKRLQQFFAVVSLIVAFLLVARALGAVAV